MRTPTRGWQALWIGMACCLVGCAASEQDDPQVARAFDQVLRWSDLRQVIPLGAAPEDSAAMAEAYINTWLHQQVELHHAELNLAESQKGFEAELRAYRNSLLLFAYEEALVRQRLDTVITQEELNGYYRDHASDFELHDDILRARWFRLEEPDRKARKRIEDRFLSGDPAKMHEVEILLAERGIAITDRSDRWMALAEIRNEVPLESVAGAGPDGRRLVIQDGGASWFIDILELRPRLSPSPIALVKQEIRSIILNQRKLRLLEGMREDLYREALAGKHIELP
jgi:hypothetical protein